MVGGLLLLCLGSEMCNVAKSLIWCPKIYFLDGNQQLLKHEKYSGKLVLPCVWEMILTMKPHKYHINTCNVVLSIWATLIIQIVANKQTHVMISPVFLILSFVITFDLVFCYNFYVVFAITFILSFVICSQISHSSSQRDTGKIVLLLRIWNKTKFMSTVVSLGLSSSGIIGHYYHGCSPILQRILRNKYQLLRFM